MANSATDPTVFGKVLRSPALDIIIGKITKASAVGTHLEPAYEGTLTGRQVRNIRKYLRQYTWLRTWWGFDTKAKRFSYRNILAVAQFGDPEDKGFNRKIVTREIFGNEVLTVEEA